MSPRKNSLSDQTEEKLYDMIVNQKLYEPGSRLPNEMQLCEQLEVSRTTLREAIRSLVAQGILITRRGSGTYVTENVAPDAQDIDFKILERAQARLSSLFEMRLVVEPEAAYLCCLRGTDKEIQRILELGKECNSAIINERDRADIDREFHQAIVAATHNDLLTRMYPFISEAVFNMIHNSNLTEQQNQISSSTMNDHTVLLEAIRTRDASAAKCAMQLHMHNAMRIAGLEAYR